MLPRGCGHCALHTGTFLKTNTSSGLPSTTKPLPRSMAEVTLSIKRQSSSRRIYSCLVPRRLRISSRTAFQIPFTRCKRLGSRSVPPFLFNNTLRSDAPGWQVWVLTGDRQETAINIGMSCRLISESMNLARNLRLSAFQRFSWVWLTGYHQRRDLARNARLHQ